MVQVVSSLARSLNLLLTVASRIFDNAKFSVSPSDLKSATSCREITPITWTDRWIADPELYESKLREGFLPNHHLPIIIFTFERLLLPSNGWSKSRRDRNRPPSEYAATNRCWYTWCVWLSSERSRAASYTHLFRRDPAVWRSRLFVPTTLTGFSFLVRRQRTGQ